MRLGETSIAKQVSELDLEPILVKLTASAEEGKGYGWSEREAKEIIHEYRAFLTKLFDKNRNGELEDEKLDFNEILDQDKLEFSQAIDIVWHTHILFTKKYHADCQKLFGRYLHHLPVT